MASASRKAGIVTARACATEIALAIPRSITDIYTLHQVVWTHVAESLAVQKNPDFLYRREGGLVRARISQCAVRIGRGSPVAVRFELGSVHSWVVQVALWRSVSQAVQKNTRERVIDLLSRAGVEVLDVECSESVGEGVKRNHRIVLPLAIVKAKVRIIDADLAHQSWIEGIGRGRRFGFGMIDAA